MPPTAGPPLGIFGRRWVPLQGTADSFSLWQLLPRRLAARGLARQFDACFFECGSDRLARGCAGSPDLLGRPFVTVQTQA